MPRPYEDSKTISICMPRDYLSKLDRFIYEKLKVRMTRSEFIRMCVTKYMENNENGS